MKNWLFCMLVALSLLPPHPLTAGYDPAEDYLGIMQRAAACGDLDAGRAAAKCRNDWLDLSGSEEPRLDFDELLLLSRLIAHEAGSSRLSIEWKMRVGEVALNRVASPEFPNSLEEVVFQPGQYEGVDCPAFRELTDPDPDSVTAALRLLRGERLMEPAVVFQANFRQGSAVYYQLYDRLYGDTYFCLSSHPELYV